MRQVARITAGLLIRCQHGAVGLLIAMPQVNFCALLFDEDSSLSDVSVNNADMIQLYWISKFNNFFGSVTL